MIRIECYKCLGILPSIGDSSVQMVYIYWPSMSGRDCPDGSPSVWLFGSWIL